MKEKLGKIRVTFYGLDHEKNGAVRVDVFAQKLTLLVKSLRAVDKHINGRKSLDYLISDLGTGSATVQIVEDEVDYKKPYKRSSVKYFRSVAQNIQEGSSVPQDTPEQVMKPLAELDDGTGKKFSHGEMRFEDENVIRIDKSFGGRASQALDSLKSKGRDIPLYAGIAFGSFDGVLKEVDLRGKPARAKLITSIGDKELNCTCNFVTVDNLREVLNKRVIVSAVEHYDGKDRLPKRLDIKKIQILKSKGTLERWKGAFNIPYPSKEDVW